MIKRLKTPWGTLYQRNSVWYADLRKIDGGRVTLETTDKDFAMEMIESLHKKYVKEKYGITGDITIKEVLDRFLDYSKKNKVSWKADVSRVKNILEYFHSGTPLKDIKKSHMEEFLNFLNKEKNHSKNTQNRHIETLKAAITRAQNDHIFEGKNITKEIKINRVETISEKFSTNEINTILNYAKNVTLNAKTKSQFYFYPFLYIALNTGCRACEIFKLRWNDINPITIRLYHTKHHKLKKKEMGFEEIPMLSCLWDLLQTLPKDSLNIINTTQREANTFRKIWLRMRKELNLNKHATFHWIRNSATSYLLDQKVQPNIVQAIMRYSDFRRTKDYTRASFEKAREEMKKLGNISKIE